MTAASGGAAQIEGYTAPFLEKVPAMMRAFAPTIVGLISPDGGGVSKSTSRGTEARRDEAATKRQKPLHHGASSPGKAGIQGNGQLNLIHHHGSVKTKTFTAEDAKGRRGTQEKRNHGEVFRAEIIARRLQIISVNDREAFANSFIFNIPNFSYRRATEARRKQKIKCILFGPLIHGCIQDQSIDISDFSLQQKNENTEELISPQTSGQ